MIWVSFPKEGNKRDEKRLAKLWRVQKWTKAKDDVKDFRDALWENHVCCN